MSVAMPRRATGERLQENLRRLLRPRHIAFVGGKVLSYPLRVCEQIGYRGAIWVVNPHHAEIAGHRCFASLDDLPEAPDAVFLAVNRELSVPHVRALAEMGAGGCIAYAAGFAEVGPEGAALQRQLVEAAGDMALVGPNCYGVLNYLDGAALWASPAGGTHVERGVAIVSQSGNIALNLTMTERSVPLAYVISVGNQAALGLGDFIAPLVDDPRVTAIGLYIEGLADVAGFSRAAEYALAKGKPIVAIKVGRSEIASRLAMTHTSSLAGSDQLYDALFERLGILRVGSLPALMETLKLLSIGQPRPGRKLGVLTCSGGDAALVADLAQDLGLELPALSDRQVAALKQQLPVFAVTANPLDYNTSIWGRVNELERCFATIMGEVFDTTMLVLDYCRPGVPGIEEWDACIDAMIRARSTTGKSAVVVSSFPELLPEAARDKLIAGGVVPLQGLEQAMEALAGAARYEALREAALARAAAGALRLEPVTVVSDSAEVIDEVDSKRRLASFGLPVPGGRVVSAAEAPDAAAEIGFPVVLKAAGSAFTHKTELGAVALDLKGAEAVRKAAAAMQARLEGHDRFLVERMAGGAVAELIVGVKRDPQFGLALVLGAGGILVNLVEDAATLLLPTDRASVATALDGLKVSRLLKGYRGQPPGDRDAVIEAVLAVAAYAQSECDRLLELDVNPLLVLPEGQGAVAADALIRLATTKKGDSPLFCHA
ncbi:MAG: acetate--CoA ligase family protein [Kiloniellales bacterium]